MRFPTGRLVWQRWRYRRGSSALIFAAALLVMAAAALGPCYERAVEQASVRTAFDRAAVADAGVTVALDASTATSTATATGAGAKYFEAPIRQTEESTVLVRDDRPYTTTLANRDDQCQHLTLVAGVCPSTGAQVVASSSSARAIGLRVGQHIDLAVPFAPITIPVTIVGLYEPIRATDPYWFDRSYLSSAAGLFSGKNSDNADVSQINALFGPPAFVADQALLLTRERVALTHVAFRLPELPVVSADVVLHQDQIDVAALPALADTMNRFETLGPPGTLTASSQLPVILDHLERVSGRPAPSNGSGRCSCWCWP